MRIDDVRGIRVGTKMSTIADVIVALCEPVILFVQWKSMMQKMRAVLRGRELRVYTLDGNGAQRRRSLDNFSDAGGVLLLSLSDSLQDYTFRVRHIVFARGRRRRPTAGKRYRGAGHRSVSAHRPDSTVYAHSFVISETAERICGEAHILPLTNRRDERVRRADPFFFLSSPRARGSSSVHLQKIFVNI